MEKRGGEKREKINVCVRGMETAERTKIIEERERGRGRLVVSESRM